jgi:hypothetical protein
MIKNKTLRSLRNALDRCDTPKQYIRVIRKIARTGDTDAIRILARLLDMPGAVGAAAVTAITSFGHRAEPEMRRWLAMSMDADQLRNARRVLAKLGLPESVAGVPELGWVEREALIAEEERAEEAERLEEEAEKLEGEKAEEKAQEGEAKLAA